MTTRALRIAAAVAALAAAPPPAAGPGPTAAALLDVAKAADEGDCKTVVKRGPPLLDLGGASAIPAELVPPAYDMVVACEVQEGAAAAALAHALRGTAVEASSDYLWRTRLALQVEAKQYEPAVATIEAMSQGRGAVLNGNPDLVGLTYRKVRDDAPALQPRLLKVLASDAYAPEKYYGPPDGYRYEYAVLLAEGGDKASAKAMLSGLRDPDIIAKALVDLRVRGLLDREPDLRQAMEAMLAGHRDAVARFPQRLGPLLMAAGDLRRLGRPNEAVALLQSVAARLDDPKDFEDKDEYLNWWWDGLAHSYAAAGKYAEAVAAFRKGAALNEGELPNVSQVINLASLQYDWGHGADAVATLAPLDDPKARMSPYGSMQLHGARACAHAADKHPEAAAQDLAYIRAHGKDSPATLGFTLLCLGDFEGAAAAYIRRLDDPKLRTDALRELSEYDASPSGAPDPLGNRLAALRGRADVKAAIARAGGTRRFHLQPPEV
jgi:tetratricopeptide (TPR) repeat protein